MQKNKRLRIFAGPNGSGKSTLFNEFKKQYDPGVFINADELEQQLKSTGLIDLDTFGLKATSDVFATFIKTKDAVSLMTKATLEGYSINIEVRENFIVDKAKNTHSYEASLTAAFIRFLLYKSKKSFSFETVMSHPAKLKEISSAKRKGYKTYLYFVCTESSEINIDRITNRVEKGGHQVDHQKIMSRYKLTLQNLYPAIKLVNRCFLFDNSGKKLELIAEGFEGSLQIKQDKQPRWFINYVLPYFS